MSLPLPILLHPPRCRTVPQPKLPAPLPFPSPPPIKTVSSSPLISSVHPSQHLSCEQPQPCRTDGSWPRSLDQASHCVLARREGGAGVGGGREAGKAGWGGGKGERGPLRLRVPGRLGKGNLGDPRQPGSPRSVRMRGPVLNRGDSTQSTQPQDLGKTPSPGASTSVPCGWGHHASSPGSHRPVARAKGPGAS